MKFYNYLKINFISALLLLLAFSSNFKDNYALGVQLPSYFPVCYRNDPNLSKCIVEASETLRPYLKAGIPELKLLPFEPLSIPYIAFKQGSKSLSIDANLTDSLFYGLTGYKFSKLEFHPDNYQFVAETNVGNLKMSGKYDLTGHLFFTPINSKGNYISAFKNCTVKSVISCKLKVIDGYEYLVPVHANSTIDVVSPTGQLIGDFYENPVLKAAIDAILRDNIVEIFEELKPGFLKIVNYILKDVLLKQITESMPYDKLFPLK